MMISSRARRNRKSEPLRKMLAETDLTPSRLIWPLFILDQDSGATEITSLPGQFRWGRKDALEQMKAAQKKGIHSFALFPVIPESQKDKRATQALNRNHSYLQFLKKVKDQIPESVIITDLALDPFSSDGHDGLVKDGKVLNDETVEILSEMAVLHAETGIDIVAPSDMMDGRVGAIRSALDDKGFEDVSIMAYTAKYASAFYGPFRDALSSAPKFGDKKTYQMDFRNRREALRELALDLREGADIVMVKPALSYLDVIADVKRKSSVPVAAYNVSGEYAMLKFAARAGALDEKKAILETLYSIRRAGADVILTYHAFEIAESL